LAAAEPNQWLLDHGVGALPVCFADADGDRHGGPEQVFLDDLGACPSGTAALDDDCDDDDPTVALDCGDPPGPTPRLRAASGRCETGAAAGWAGLFGAVAALRRRRRRARAAEVG
ncbi:MAG: hypothetical protein R3F59_39130, partial [Myxococcota bacterium]